MPERTLLRIGAASAIVGAVLAIIVLAIHPRPSDPSDSESLLEVAADSTLWTSLDIGIIVAILLATGGLAALYRSITGEPGAALARLGFVAALLGAAIGIVVFSLEGIAVKEVAEAWATAPSGEKAMALGVGDALFALLVAFVSFWFFVF